MNDISTMLDTAIIKWDGDARERGPNGEPISVYVVETEKGRFWFEGDLEYSENGNDFLIKINNFGLSERSWAGTTERKARFSFTKEEASAAKLKLEALFSGPPNNPALPLLPFGIGKGKFLGVKYAPNWINIK